MSNAANITEFDPDAYLAKDDWDPFRDEGAIRIPLYQEFNKNAGYTKQPAIHDISFYEVAAVVAGGAVFLALVVWIILWIKRIKGCFWAILAQCLCVLLALSCVALALFYVPYAYKVTQLSNGRLLETGIEYGNLFYPPFVRYYNYSGVTGNIATHLLGINWSIYAVYWLLLGCCVGLYSTLRGHLRRL